jgi:hypothetical protein
MGPSLARNLTYSVQTLVAVCWLWK